IVLTCSMIASVTFGLLWPTLTVSTPPKQSRYLLPASSQTYSPSPRTSASGSWWYIATAGKRNSLCLRTVSDCLEVCSMALIFTLYCVRAYSWLVIDGIFFVVPDFTESVFRQLGGSLHEATFVALGDEVYEVLDFGNPLRR